MGRIVLTEEDKRKIKDMYSDVKSSDKLMSYLKRNFRFFKPIDEMGLDDEGKQEVINDLPFFDKMVKIIIDEKSYTLNNEKKYIKNRIYYVIQDEIDRIDPDATKAVVLKTIKEYLDKIILYYGLNV